MPLVYLRSLAQRKVVSVLTSSLPPKPTAMPYWRAPGPDKANIELSSPEHAMLSTPLGQKNSMDECLQSSTDSHESDNEQDKIGWCSGEQHDPKLYADASSTDSNVTDNA